MPIANRAVLSAKKTDKNTHSWGSVSRIKYESLFTPYTEHDAFITTGTQLLKNGSQMAKRDTVNKNK